MTVHFREFGEPAKLEAEYLVCCIPLAILKKIPVTPAWPEAKAFVIRNVVFGSQARVVLQSRTKFWKGDVPSINLETGDSAMYLVYQTADEVPGTRGVLMGSGRADVTADEALAAFRRFYPGQEADGRAGDRAQLGEGPLGVRLRADAVPAGSAQEVLAAHHGAGGPDPLRRLVRRQPPLGHGRRDPLGQPRGRDDRSSLDPPRVVRAAVVDPSGDEPRVPAVGIHHPDRRRSSRPGPAEDHVLAVGRFARAKIPDRWIASGEVRDPSVARIEPADLGAAAGEFGFEVAVEVVHVGALGLVFPGDLGARQPAREEDRAVVGPRGDVRAASPRLRVAVGGREPHGLAAREHAVFAAIGAADADVGPVVAWVLARVAVYVEDPVPVRRPVRAEVEVPWLGGDPDAIRAVGVAGPDLVALRTCEVERDPQPVGTEAQPIGEPLAGPCEFARVGAVEPDAEDLADVLAYDLHEEPVVLQQRAGVTNGARRSLSQISISEPVSRSWTQRCVGVCV